MTENRIAEKTAADKRKALLALATDQDEHPGPCLSPAAMADLVAGVSPEEKKRQALRHVSRCRHCYDEWLILAGMALEQRRGRHKGERIPFYLKPANLAALVSAMAAAICIGLFLDINPFGYRIEPGRDVVPLRQERAVPVEKPAAPSETSALPADAGKKPAQPQRLQETGGAGNAGPSRGRPADTAGQSEMPEAAAPAPMAAPVTPPAPEPAARQEQAMRREVASPPAETVPGQSTPEPMAADRAAGAPISREADAEKGMAGTDAQAASLAGWAEDMLAACRYEQRTGQASTERQVLFRSGKRSFRQWQNQPQAADSLTQSSPLLSLLERSTTEEELFARCPEMLAAAAKEGR
jgi:hypothetical protein